MFPYTLFNAQDTIKICILFFSLFFQRSYDDSIAYNFYRMNNTGTPSIIDVCNLIMNQTTQHCVLLHIALIYFKKESEMF